MEGVEHTGIRSVCKYIHACGSLVRGKAYYTPDGVPGEEFPCVESPGRLAVSLAVDRRRW